MIGRDHDSDRVRATTGPGQPFAVRYDDTRTPDAQASAARDQVIEIDERELERLIRMRVRRSEEHLRRAYETWHERRVLRHSTESGENNELFAATSPKEPEHRSYYNPNVLRPHIEQLIATVCAQRFDIRFHAATEDYTDAFKAQQAQAITKYHNRFDKPRALRRAAMESAVDCDALFVLKIYEDQHKGDLLGYALNAKGVESPVYNGVARIGVIPAHRLGFDPAARWQGEDGLEACGWLYDKQRLTRADLSRHLTPEEMALVDENEREARHNEGDWAQARLDDPRGPIGSRAASEERHGDRPYEYIEYYQKADADEWTKGIFAITVNGKVIRAQPELPYFGACGSYPFVVGNIAPIEAKMLGFSYTGACVEPQKAIQRTESHRQEKNAAAASVKILTIGAGGKPTGEWTNEQAQQIDYPQGTQVIPFEVKPAGPDEYTESDRAKRFMSDLTHAPSTSWGGAAADFDKTAKEAGLLHDAAQMSIGPIVESLNASFEAAEKKRLKLASQLYDMPRQLRIAGDGSMAQVVHFQGADIAGYEDIEVYSNTTLPPGPFGKLQLIERLSASAAALGLVVPGGPPLFTREQFLAMADVRAADYGDVGRMRDKAEQEAMNLLTAGVPPLFLESQDHETRIEVYRRVLESTAAEQAPLPHVLALDLEIKKRFQFVQQTQLAAMAAATEAQQPPDAENDSSSSKGGDKPQPAAAQAA